MGLYVDVSINRIICSFLFQPSWFCWNQKKEKKLHFWMWSILLKSVIFSHIPWDKDHLCIECLGYLVSLSLHDSSNIIIYTQKGLDPFYKNRSFSTHPTRQAVVIPSTVLALTLDIKLMPENESGLIFFSGIVHQITRCLT